MPPRAVERDMIELREMRLDPELEEPRLEGRLQVGRLELDDP
jgi:hypothetical protein